MIGAIIDASIRNRTLTLIGAFVLFVTGLVALQKTPLDAIPDLSDTQVIVFTEYPGQAPQVVEDQVTYPLTLSLIHI